MFSLILALQIQIRRKWRCLLPHLIVVASFTTFEPWPLGAVLHRPRYACPAPSTTSPIATPTGLTIACGGLDVKRAGERRASRERWEAGRRRIPPAAGRRGCLSISPATRGARRACSCRRSGHTTSVLEVGGGR
jgi:hypothetical protein